MELIADSIVLSLLFKRTNHLCFSNHLQLLQSQHHIIKMLVAKATFRMGTQDVSDLESAHTASPNLGGTQLMASHHLCLSFFLFEHSWCSQLTLMSSAVALRSTKGRMYTFSIKSRRRTVCGSPGGGSQLMSSACFFFQPCSCFQLNQQLLKLSSHQTVVNCDDTYSCGDGAQRECCFDSHLVIHSLTI